MLRGSRIVARKKLHLPSLKQAASYKLVQGPVVIAGSNDALSHEELRTVTNGITKEPMRIHAISGYVSVLYLCQYPAREQPNVFALDCGTASDAGRIDFFLRNFENSSSTEAPPSETAASPQFNDVLKMAVATHAHPDHSGASETYAKAGVEVTAPKHIHRYYRGLWGKAQLMSERFLLTTFAYMLKRTRLERPNMSGHIPVSPHLPALEDGKFLPCGFDDWMAIAIYGHTAHMVGLFHAASGVFYAADFIIRHRGRFTAPVPLDMPEEYIATIARLRSLPVRWLLLAHGGIVNIDDIAGGWDFVLDEVEAHCRKGVVSPVLKLVEPFFSFGPESKLFDPATERPRGAIRIADVDAVPVTHLK